MKQNRFYSYLWLRRDLTPYYAGKGSGIRAFSNIGHRCQSPEEQWRILIFPHSTEEDAFEHEKFLIAIFGRKDNGTGVLRNLTDGGDNPPSALGRICSPEHKKRVSESRKGKPSPLRGRKMSEEMRAKLRAAWPKRTGHPHTEETRQRISATMKLRGLKPTKRFNRRTGECT